MLRKHITFYYVLVTLVSQISYMVNITMVSYYIVNTMLMDGEI